MSGLDIEPEQSKNNNPARKNLAQSCKIQRVIYLFFKVDRYELNYNSTYGLVVNLTRNRSEFEDIDFRRSLALDHQTLQRGIH